MPIALPLARRMTTALSLLAGSAALIAVLTFSVEARAGGPKQGASTAQVLAQESKPMPNAASHPSTANAHAKPHAKTNANAKAKAQPHAKAKTKAKVKPQAKPAKAPAKPSKPAPSARV